MSMGIQIYINGPAKCGKTQLAEILRDTIAKFDEQNKLTDTYTKVAIIEQRTMSNANSSQRP